jgi:hypothetical protein
MSILEPCQLAAEDHVAVGRGVVRKHDVGVRVPREQVAQHGHERRDPAPAGQHEDLRRRRIGQDEATEGLPELDRIADAKVIVQIPGHAATRVTLHGERDGAAVERCARGAVDSCVPYPVDLDHQRDVLAGAEAPPVPVRAKNEAHHVPRLGTHRLDAREDATEAEARLQPARVEVEHVLVEEPAHGRGGGEPAEGGRERCES